MAYVYRATDVNSSEINTTLQNWVTAGWDFYFATQHLARHTLYFRQETPQQQ